MARARNIKPGFFENEILGVQDPFVCLLFAGLWTLADKAGILEDRPMRIKAQLFPYRESLDVNGHLTVLQRLGFIRRYEVDGSRYIEVTNFKKHQSPHHTERASIFPAYSSDCEITVNSPLDHGGNPPDSLIHRFSDSPIHRFTDSLMPESTAAPSLERDAEKPAKRKAQTARGTRLSPDWIPSDTNLAYCRSQRRDLDPARVADNFRDYWTAKPGAGATKLDWDAAWRTWVRNERASPRQTLNDQRKATLDELTGRTRNGIPQQPTEPRDITGESWLIA
jgi:hypothetical protein